MPNNQLPSQLLSEFIGTFVLVWTASCNVLGNTGNFNAISIACVLMVMVYSLGGVSGAHFNPAVTFACAVAGKLEHALQGLTYVLVQIIGATVAGLCMKLLNGEFGGPIKPQGTSGAVEALVTEFLYTFMLCFVVLNVACYSKAAGNHYYGLAIGFVIAAGGYGGGPVSGGAFNPAVVVGFGPMDGSNAKWMLAYAGVELAGGFVAGVLFLTMRRDDYDPEWAPSLLVKLLSEFLGTFFLCLTVGMNVFTLSKAAAFSIAASLLCMVYALGSCSGAHFNPAVTLAILTSGRNLISVLDALLYMITQFLGGIAGVLTAYALAQPKTGLGHLGPNPGARDPLGRPYKLMDCADEETIFTFVLCFTVLCVATSKFYATSQAFGLAIGMCITVGGVSIGGVTGACLNPAVSLGIEVTNAVGHARNGTGGPEGPFAVAPVAMYVAFQYLGGILAAFAYRVTHMGEYFELAEEKKRLLESRSEHSEDAVSAY